MKRILASLAALCGATLASAQTLDSVPLATTTLREIVRTADGAVFIDEGSIRRDGHRAFAWLLTALAADRALPSGAMMRASFVQNEYDCDTRTVRPVRVGVVAPDLTAQEAAAPERPAQQITAGMGDTVDLACGLRTAMPGARANSLAAAITSARTSAPPPPAAAPVATPTTSRLAPFDSDTMDGAEVVYFIDEASRRTMGTRASAWLLFAFTQDRQMDGRAASALWMLVEANCAARTIRDAGQAYVAPDLTALAGHRMTSTSPARPAPANTSGGQWLDLACGAAPAQSVRFASAAEAIRAVRAAAR